MATPSHPRADWRERVFGPGLRAFQAYGKLFVAIQLAAGAFVLLYKLNADVRAACEIVGHWKVAGGLLATALTTMISGGVIPELLKWKLRPAHLRPPTLAQIAHRFSFFALLGVMVDLFYRLQGLLFGTGDDVGTLASKLLVDELLFTPLVSMPFTTLWFYWGDVGFSFRRMRHELTWQAFWDRYLAIWSVCLAYWPVVLIFVYAMPSNLQFPLFLFVNAAWGVVMVLIASRGEDQ